MNTLRNRLRRIEERHRPALSLAASCILASNPDSAAQKIAERVEAGTHRPGWPLLVITSPAFQENRP